MKEKDIFVKGKDCKKIRKKKKFAECLRINAFEYFAFFPAYLDKVSSSYACAIGARMLRQTLGKFFPRYTAEIIMLCKFTTKSSFFFRANVGRNFFFILFHFFWRCKLGKCTHIQTRKRKGMMANMEKNELNFQHKCVNIFIFLL
jgi:hypothetical protein